MACHAPLITIGNRGLLFAAVRALSELSGTRWLHGVSRVWHGVRCRSQVVGMGGAMAMVAIASRSAHKCASALVLGNSMTAGSDGASESWLRDSRWTVACRILPATVRTTAV